MSERDWNSIREFREFDRQQRDRQRLAEDREQYERYVETVNKDQERVPPRFRIEPLDFDAWRAFADAEQDDPAIRGAAATNRALLNRLSQVEEKDNEAARQAILAGKPDTDYWKLPGSALGLGMTVEQAKKFAQAQSEQFVRENPDYETYRSAETYEAITNYLLAQPDLQIPNSDCFRIAFNRLRDLGLLKPAPAVAPEAAPIEPDLELEPTEAPREELIGWDQNTGKQRTFTQREVDLMSSEEYRRVFRLCGDRKPRFTRSRYE